MGSVTVGRGAIRSTAVRAPAASTADAMRSAKAESLKAANAGWPSGRRPRKARAIVVFSRYANTSTGVPAVTVGAITFGGTVSSIKRLRWPSMRRARPCAARTPALEAATDTVARRP